VKAVSSTTKNRANNDDDESREDTNDDDSNSVDARKRNGKPSSTDAGASGKNLFNIYNLKKKYFFFIQVIQMKVEIMMKKMMKILKMMVDQIRFLNIK
jgi:hypothetical protein